MEVRTSTKIEPTRDERLALYLVIVVLGTAFAVFGGGLAAMLLVTPFAVALPLGMRRRADAVIDVRVTLDTQRCLEGDTVTGPHRHHRSAGNHDRSRHREPDHGVDRTA